MTEQQYLMAGQQSELERLRRQSLIWEPAGHKLLERVGDGTGLRALDVGCGALGWLRVLSRWVGSSGTVTGTDIEPKLLAAAAEFVAEESLSNVKVIADDFFASKLAPHSFDLVHARFQLCPIGRIAEHMQGFERLLAPGGYLVMEDPDSGSWHFNPPAPAAERLIELIKEAFVTGGGHFDMGRREPEFIRAIGLEPHVDSHVLALPPRHPYLRVVIEFSRSLESRLLKLIDPATLEDLRASAEDELADAARWGTTFTLIQTWAQAPR